MTQRASGLSNDALLGCSCQLFHSHLHEAATDGMQRLLQLLGLPRIDRMHSLCKQVVALSKGLALCTVSATHLQHAGSAFALLC